MDTGYIIVEAKTQYIRQLVDALAPAIYSGMRRIFDKCKNIGEGRRLKKFQERLCMVPKWNQEIIDYEYNKIQDISKCDWLDSMLEAIIVCNVKILSTIKSDNKKPVDIKIPETKQFIHKCYTETARAYYTNPYLAINTGTSDSIDRINQTVRENFITIENCIIKTINDLIPQKDIIQNFLSPSEPGPCHTEKNLSSESESESESESGYESDTRSSSSLGSPKPVLDPEPQHDDKLRDVADNLDEIRDDFLMNPMLEDSASSVSSRSSRSSVSEKHIEMSSSKYPDDENFTFFSDED